MKIVYFNFAHTRLTLKEMQITSLLCDGLLHKQIADYFGITQGTVDHRVSHLLHKVHVKNSKELVALAHEQGMQRGGVFRGENLFDKKPQ